MGIVCHDFPIQPFCTDESGLVFYSINDLWVGNQRRSKRAMIIAVITTSMASIAILATLLKKVIGEYDLPKFLRLMLTTQSEHVRFIDIARPPLRFCANEFNPRLLIGCWASSVRVYDIYLYAGNLLAIEDASGYRRAVSCHLECLGAAAQG